MGKKNKKKQGQQEQIQQTDNNEEPHEHVHGPNCNHDHAPAEQQVVEQRTAMERAEEYKKSAMEIHNKYCN